jgi:hypothetical protein
VVQAEFAWRMRTGEVAMISQSCDVREFIEAIRDRDYLEVIYLADKEATEAERLKYRFKAKKRAEQEYCPGYADVLKNLIFFLRYGVKNRLIGKKDFDLFRSLRESLLERMQPESETIH